MLVLEKEEEPVGEIWEEGQKLSRHTHMHIVLLKITMMFVVTVLSGIQWVLVYVVSLAYI